MKTADRAMLLDLLDRAFDHVSWHGANLTGALRGVNAAMAARRIDGRKTIWEQALHAAYWKQRVLNKLVGRTPFARKGSNWPAAAVEVSKKTWREDLKLLGEIHGRVREAVKRLPPAKMTPKMVFMVQGAALHDVYHAGQIKLLRRMLIDGA